MEKKDIKKGRKYWSNFGNEMKKVKVLDLLDDKPDYVLAKSYVTWGKVYADRINQILCPVDTLWARLCRMARAFWNAA